jgi:hypothetical protein
MAIPKPTVPTHLAVLALLQTIRLLRVTKLNINL